MTEKNTPTTEHLGDGVYVIFDGYGLELRANDHRNPVVVYLEPGIFEALVQFAHAQSPEYYAPLGSPV